MIEKAIGDIIKDDLDALVAAAVPERRTLDYKQQLPGGSDAARKEFLGDIASLANAAGGDILYGVRDIRDENNRPTGTPELLGLADFNADCEKLRLDQMIRNGIAPRVPGVAFHVVEGFQGGPILIVRVPRSWLAPHMVTFQEHSRFYTRNASGRYVMDVQEIRSAFSVSEELPERIRRFRDERLARILGGEAPVAVSPGPRIVLHLVPASAVSRGTQVDVPSLHGLLMRLAPMSTGSGWSDRFNLDGYLTYSGTRDAPHNYVQVMRTGAIEAINVHPFGGEFGSERGPFIYSTDCERQLIEGTKRYLFVQRDIGIPPPVFILVSLVGVKGYRLGADATIASPYDRVAIDRDVLLLPDVVLDDYAAAEDCAGLLRAAFDALWQAAGFRRSPNFAADGTWRPHA